MSTAQPPMPAAASAWATLHPDWRPPRRPAEDWQHLSWTVPAAWVTAIAGQAWGPGPTTEARWPGQPGRPADAISATDAMLTAMALALLSRHGLEDEALVGLAVGASAETGDKGLRLRPLRAGAAAGLGLAALCRSVATRLVPPLDGPDAGAATIAILVGCRFESIAPRQRTGLEAVLALAGDGEQVQASLSLPVGLFAAGRPQRMLSHWQALLRQAAASPDMPLQSVALLSGEERAALLALGAGPVRRWASAETLHGGFEDQARRSPQALAAIHHTQTITYGALNDRADALASSLLAMGLPRGSFVGLLLPRGIDFLVAMLGVMKAGAAYVPLDPTYPRERVMAMLRDSAAPCLVSNDGLLQSYAGALTGLPDPPRPLRIDAVHDGCRPDRPAVPGPALGGRDRAYMIYTSGSSGRPKGAICRHDGALNHLWGELDGLGLHGPFRFLQSAPSSSDISVWQFLAPLQLGGACVIVDRDTVVDPRHLLAALQRHAVTLAEPVPSVLRALLDHLDRHPDADDRLPALRCMMCSGEAMPPDLVGRWFQRYPMIPLANTYGPTEASDDVSLLVLDRAVAFDGGAVPIGLPLPNLQLMLLDADQQWVPWGAPGEICVAGVGVGEGYWRQPEKTAAAFLPSPLPEVPGLLYRTGDLGRWRPDGWLDYLGRLDQQVKIRGHRVEPGEVEQALRAHPGVADAAVVAIAGASGGRRLHAAYTCPPGASTPPAALRGFLADRLPEHMIPSSWAQHAELPRTPMGKLDRAALQGRPDPLESVADDGPASDSVLDRLALAWRRALGLPMVQPQDHFFEIGGDSLSTLAVAAEAASLGLQLTASQLFEYPRLADLAASLQAAGSVAPGPLPIARRQAPAQAWQEACKAALAAARAINPEVEDAYPLSPTQRDMYFQLLLQPRSAGVYIEQVGFRLQGLCDGDRLVQAWQRTVDQIDMLRTGITRVPGKLPVQFVQIAARCEVGLHDHRDLGPADQSAAWDSLLQQARRDGFDLQRPPLMRIAAVRQDERTWQLLWTYHHLVLDGQSEALVLRAFLANVDRGSQAASRTPPIGAAPAPAFRDLLGWLDGRDPAASEAFWRQQLDGFQPPPPLVDAERPAVGAGLGAGHDTVRLDLPAGLPDRMARWQRRHGLTAATLLHGAWAQLLHRRTGQVDVVLGAVSSGRQAGFSGLQAVCGPVLVTQPLRSTCLPGDDLVAWLCALQVRLARLRDHEHTPLAHIHAWCGDNLGRRPLFDSVVIQARFAGDDADLRLAAEQAGLVIDGFALGTQPAYGLTLVALEQPEPHWRLVFERRRFSAQFASALLQDCMQWLAATVSAEGDDGRPVV